jgi:hypothetical protein
MAKLEQREEFFPGFQDETFAIAPSALVEAKQKNISVYRNGVLVTPSDTVFRPGDRLELRIEEQ